MPIANTGSGAGGAATVVTAIASAAKTAGAQALVKAGSTPFDFISMTYDTGYAKWVSAPYQYCSAFTLFTTSASATAWGLCPTRSGGATLGIVGAPMIPYASPLAAGLTLQARITTVMTIATAGTATVDLSSQTVSLNGDYNAAVNASGMTLTTTSATNVAKDSGWVDLSPGASADFVILEPNVKSSSGNTVSLTSPSCWWRWVG